MSFLRFEFAALAPQVELDISLELKRVVEGVEESNVQAVQEVEPLLEPIAQLAHGGLGQR